MEQTTGTLNNVPLICDNVSKEFDSFDGSGKNEVLKDISFQVEKNEFLVLFGPGQ